MKGLLIKDFINQKSQAVIYIFIFILWGFLAFSDQTVNMLPIFIAILSVMSTVTAVAIDDRSKFNSYAVCMPLSRFDIIFCKYLYNIIVTLVGVVISFTIYYCMNGNIVENLLMCLMGISVSLVCAAIFLPLMFKLGIEKARFVLFALALIPFVMMFVFPSVHISVSVPSINEIKTAICFMPVIALAITFISVFISERIYKNKEF